MSIINIITGIVIGFSIAAPVGPIGLLCASRTLTRGWKSGLVSGLGAATADGIYACVAGFGITFLTQVLMDHQVWLRLGGGIILIVLGCRAFFAETNRDMNGTSETTLVRDYLGTFILTLTNPATIVSFAAIFAGPGFSAVASAEWAPRFSLIAGVIIGSAVWWLALSTIVDRFRKGITERQIRIINRVAGTVICGFGITTLMGLTV